MNGVPKSTPTRLSETEEKKGNEECSEKLRAADKKLRTDRTKWLDLALEGTSSEIRARVLEIIVKMKIDPEDEFFIIFVAIGQLQALIEYAPKEWKELFASFQQELIEWGKTNLEILSQMALKTEMMEKLAYNSEQLGNILKEFIQVCTGLIGQLQESNLLLTNSINGLQIANKDHLLQTKNELTQFSQTTNQLLNSLESKIDQLKPSLETSLVSPPLGKIKNLLSTGSFNLFLGGISYFLVFWVGFYSAFLPQQRLLLEMHEQTQWLLDKANRRDCIDGIKKLDSPECFKFVK